MLGCGYLCQNRPAVVNCGRCGRACGCAGALAVVRARTHTGARVNASHIPQRRYAKIDQEHELQTKHTDAVWRGNACVLRGRGLSALDAGRAMPSSYTRYTAAVMLSTSMDAVASPTSDRAEDMREVDRGLDGGDELGRCWGDPDDRRGGRASASVGSEAGGGAAVVAGAVGSAVSRDGPAAGLAGACLVRVATSDARAAGSGGSARAEWARPPSFGCNGAAGSPVVAALSAIPPKPILLPCAQPRVGSEILPIAAC